MDVTVKVDVATRRPPGEHDFVTVTLAMDLPETQTNAEEEAAFRAALVDARELACLMSTIRENVVMPVRATVIGVDNY